MVEHQQKLLAHKRVNCAQRMPLVVLVPFDLEAVVVAEIHGVEVVRHVGHTVPDDKVGGQPVSARKVEIVSTKSFQSHSVH